MSLPPLPKELAAFAETQARHCSLNDMVQAYGQACREQALEEAINCYSPDDTASDWIDKIRSLKP